MTELRTRFALLEKEAENANGVVGLAERMRKIRAERIDEPRQPRTREELEAVVARNAPDSLAHKLAKRALLHVGD
ncbi:MAG: hypothetical protein V4645_11505 [Pseudomonadota bacterium]